MAKRGRKTVKEREDRDVQTLSVWEQNMLGVMFWGEPEGLLPRQVAVKISNRQDNKPQGRA
ncbi:MAG: hypothetical protein Q8P83_01500 [bacterium]|nr:hypothetical protein [bacterium]